MSTVSLEELNAQIQQLEAQRAQLQSDAKQHHNEAKAGVIQQLIEKISTYGITAKDLGLKTTKGSKTQAKPTRKPLGAEIAQSGKTHTGPEGQTWTEGARGCKPAWLNEQLSETAELAAS